MEQAFKHSDVFLTHTWRPDLHGRNNHDRVRVINQRLNRLGFSSWFDEIQMEGEIEAKMAEGVDHTRCVIVFVTKQYMQKIDAVGKDNCKYEFDRAVTQKTKKNILCVVMEDDYNNPDTWFGKMKEKLGDCLFVSMSGNLNDEVYFKRQLDPVVEQLKSKGVTPSQMKKICQDCTRVGKDRDPQALFGDGDYCTYCGCTLQTTAEAKHHCSRCNKHENGEFCSACKGHLLDREMIIAEQSQQLIKMLAIDSNSELDRFDTAGIQQTIETFQQELLELQAKRTRALNNGEDLELSDAEFDKKMEMLEQGLGKIVREGNTLAESADNCSNLLEPAYEKDLNILRQVIQSLSEKRSEMNQQSSNFDRAAEDIQRFKQQVADLKVEVTKEKLPFLHDKTCKCVESNFERELTSQLIKDPVEYLKNLMLEDNVRDLASALESKKEILELRDRDGSNLLMSLATIHGSLNMFQTILDAGAGVESTNSRNETFLHLTKDLDKISLLCEQYGGHKLLSIQNADGKTPFVNAIVNNDIAVVEVLKKYVQSPEVEMLEYEGFKYIETLIKSDDITTMTTLLTHKKEIVDAKDRDGLNLLMSISTNHGSLNMFQTILDAGAGVESTNSHNETFLHLTKDLDKISLLCEQHNGHKLLSIRNADGKTPLMNAIMNNDVAVVEVLKKYVESPEVEMIEGEFFKQGFKYIATLYKNNDITTMTTLLTRKKEIVVARDRDGLNLLMSFSTNHGSLNMFQTILDAGAGVESTNSRNETFLHLTTDLDKISLLCEQYGGHKLLSIRNADGKTPLMNAIMNNDVAVVEVLKKYVESPEVEMIEGEMFKQGFKYIETLIKNDNITSMNMLLTCKSDIVHMKNAINMTPFLYCCEFGSLPMLKILDQHGSDPTARGGAGYTALILAVMKGDEEKVRWLCDHHHSLLTLENEYGQNVFHFAYNKQNIVSILLQYSPPVHMLEKNNWMGQTPFSEANKDVVKLFKKYKKMKQKH